MPAIFQALMYSSSLSYVLPFKYTSFSLKCGDLDSGISDQDDLLLQYPREFPWNIVKYGVNSSLVCIDVRLSLV